MAFLEDQVAINMQSVVDQISSFAVANAGFTALPDVILAGTTTTLKILLKGGMYYYLFGSTQVLPDFTPARTVGVIYLRMMRVEPTLANYNDIGTTIDAQRTPSKACTFSNIDGVFEGLNLYTDGNAVHVALEIFSNVFAHLSFGIVDKFGAWTGGEYTMANGIFYSDTTDYIFLSNFNTFLFDGGYSSNRTTTLLSSYGINYIYRPLPIAGASNNWTDYPRMGTSTLPSGATQYCKSSGMYYTDDPFFSSGFTWALFKMSPNTTTLRTMLIPIYMRVSYELDDSLVHLAGHIPSAKYLNIQAIDPKEVVDVNWKVYPYTAKFGDTTNEPVSDNYGIAYQRV